MDKRSLLFIACVSLAFFGVQAWFSWNNKNARPIVLQPLENPLPKNCFAGQKAKLGDLPLAVFYADDHCRQAIGYGALGNHSILTLAWSESIPDRIFAEEFGEMTLASPGYRMGDPVIYSSENFKAFTAPPIPADAPADLQLLASVTNPKIAMGQQRGCVFALGDEPVQENALAFLKNDQGYFPVGVFDANTLKVRPLNDFDLLKPLVQQIGPPQQGKTAGGHEQFYVLENEYLQLVFSSRGGSLAEINLPLKEGKKHGSVVKEIGFDRLIVKEDPANARFPSQPSQRFNSQNPAEGSLGGYYPLLRRSIYGTDGAVRHLLDPRYYALNVVDGESEVSTLDYKVKRFEKNLIQFEAIQPQRRITKTFSIPEGRNGPYCFEANVQIEGDARGLWISSGVPDVELISGSFSPLLRYQVMRNNAGDVETIDLSDKNPVMLVTSVSPRWISNSNGFLGLIMDPTTEIGPGFRAVKIPGAAVPTRLSVIDPAYQPYPAEKFPGYSTFLPLKSGVVQTFRVFAGPYDDALLKDLDELYDDPLKGYNPEYSNAQSIQGWFSFISQPFSKFLYLLLQLFYTISGSWGFSIILLTIALRLMMYPLNNWSIKSIVRMQEIAPRVKAIQDRYKKDPKKGQLEVMNLYREQGVNPFGGCLPMLLQMPFLIGMFYLLKSTFPLRGASFIPGWIDNLAAPDVLFSWNYPVPMIGTDFHLLPIILGATMFLQQKMTSKLPKDEKNLSESQKQQKMMGNLMSVIFTVMFYGLPSGLNIYFISSNLLGMLQQWHLTKKMKEQAIIVK